MIAIKSIIIILFGSTTLSGFIKTAIEMVGLWGIFRKCGQTPWKALIPYYNDYALSECAARQPEGLHVFITGLLMAISPVAIMGMSDDSMAEIIVMFVTVAVGLDYFINLFKVYLGLIEVLPACMDGTRLFSRCGSCRISGTMSPTSSAVPMRRHLTMG